MALSQIKVFFVCSGLGHVRRGYESFTLECFEELQGMAECQTFLFKGAGKSNGSEIALPVLKRTGSAARLLGNPIGRDGYFMEQATFFAALVPHLFSKRPDVIYFSDGNLGNFLWHLRKRVTLNYKLLFSNGGPLSPPFPRWDMVQQVSPQFFSEAERVQGPSAPQVLLPYGIRIPADFHPVAAEEKAQLRRRLGLPTDRKIVISVGAINSLHKRMDYLVREIAAIPEPRPFLLLLGQRDEASEGIDRLAAEMLGASGYAIRTVESQHVADHLRSADAFVLASLAEGFGRVYVEALANGIACLVHDFETSRFVLGPCGVLRDLRNPGEVAANLPGMFASDGLEQQQNRHRYAYEKFSWDVLRRQYVEMLLAAARS